MNLTGRMAQFCILPSLRSFVCGSKGYDWQSGRRDHEEHRVGDSLIGKMGYTNEWPIGRNGCAACGRESSLRVQTQEGVLEEILRGQRRP